MTLKELIRRVALRHDVSYRLAEGFILSAVEELVLELHKGEPIQIRGLGSFRWDWVKGSRKKGYRKKDTPAGWRLRFFPARRFRTRRRSMSDEGMTKYGVELDDTKTKQASEGDDSKDCCPVCQRPLDDARACPVHGTEPFEPTE